MSYAVLPNSQPAVPTNLLADRRTFFEEAGRDARPRFEPASPAKPQFAAVHQEILTDGEFAVPTRADGSDSDLFGKDGLTFGDLIDIINPLQHIPIISTIYRELTGDEISPGARLAGSAIFGGPIGVAVAAVNLVIESETGSDIGEHIMAALTDEEPQNGSALASTEPPAKETPAPAIAAAPTAPVTASAATPAPDETARFPLFNLPPATNKVSQTPVSAGGVPFNAFTPATAAQGPASALLQAKAAVPFAGVNARIPQNPRTHFAKKSPPIKINDRLSQQLALLAARTQKDAAPTQKEDTNPKPAGTVTKNQPPAAAPRDQIAAQPLPARDVPAAMLDALKRYEKMKADSSGLR